MDFTSSITLKFNDLFSSDFARASQSVVGFETSLNQIGGAGLQDIAPPSFDGTTIDPPPVAPPVVPEPVAPPPKTGPFDAGIKQIKSGLDKIGQNTALNTVATQLSTMAYMTDPLRQRLAGMMDEPSRLAGTFESSMKNIQAITGLTADEIGKLGDELRSIGGQHAAGPQGVADAYNDVAGGITKVSAQMPVLNNAIALAEAGQADLGVASNGLVKIMNSYNFTAGETAEINERAAWASDVMTQAVGMGVGSMQEFISAMAPISGIASSVGVGFDEIGSTMAYMTATTDTASTAGTKLQSFMVALQKPSGALAEALASVGITSGSAMLAQYGLAESANIVMNAFKGNQDAMTAAMGRVEAMQAVVSLTGDTYSDFASEFGSAMDGLTAKSQAIQTQSYESKMARYQAATDALKMQVGDDINAIKGFFLDMGAGFLTNVVSPIMSSPVGGVFQTIAAGAGQAAQGVLSFGSGALNTAAQVSVLAANVKNAGGYMEMLRGVTSIGKGALTGMGGVLKEATAGMAAFSASVKSVGFLQTFKLGLTGVGGGLASMGKGIVGLLPKMGAWIASTWSAVAANVALNWPIYVVIAAVAALGVAAYFLVKHWDVVSAFFVNLWKKITGTFTIAWKSVSGGAQVAWAWMKGFFVSLWNSFKVPVVTFVGWIGGIWSTVVAGFIAAWSAASDFFRTIWSGFVDIVSSVGTWFVGVWQSIVAGFVMAWNATTAFFVNLWNGLVGIVVVAANWFVGAWGTITGAFSSAWNWVGSLFSGLWDRMKGTVMDFVEWLSPVIDTILAPFRAIGGAIDWVKGKLGIAVEEGNLAATAKRSELAQVTTPGMKAATATVASGQGMAQPTTERVTAPSLTATTTAAPTITTAPIGPAPELTHSASSAFADAIAATAPSMDMSAIERQVDMRLAEARLPQAPAIETPWKQAAEKKSEEQAPKSITIQNLTVQAEDMKNALDFIRVLMNAVHQPEATAV